MALKPHSEDPETGTPPDYAAHHPEERPEQWGWHGEWGKTARFGGYLVTALLLVMLTATHYNHSGSLWLILFAIGLVAMIVWDVQRRRNSWRK